MQRISSATFVGGAGENYNLENMSYDLNGNIKTLRRRVGTGTIEDDLQYTYAANANRLLAVADNGAKTPSTALRSGYFQDKNTNGDDYAYDNAGNLTADKNRNIASIAYNVLGLPEKITFNNNSKIVYYYTGSGEKIKKQSPTKTNGTAGATTLDYVAGMVYTNQTLTFIPTAEGRALPKATTTQNSTTQNFEYEYQQTDHLGNLRTACRCGVKLDATGALVPTLASEDSRTVVQTNHYDPWGINLTDLETVAPMGGGDWFQFNAGSEKSALPDGSYDYETDFRGYDPQIGRMKGVDLLADEFVGISPFQFGYNNPVMFNDPTGLFGEGQIAEVVIRGVSSATMMANVGASIVVGTLAANPDWYTTNGEDLHYFQNESRNEIAAGQTNYHKVAGDNDVLTPHYESKIAKVYGKRMPYIHVNVAEIPNIVSKYGNNGLYELNANTGEVISFKNHNGAINSSDSPIELFAGGLLQAGVKKMGLLVLGRNAARIGSGAAYSVAFETKLSSNLWKGKRTMHFQESNKNLLKMMDNNPAFAGEMESLIPNLRSQLVGSRGGISTEAPSGWVWHHHIDPGRMQLVPQAQHWDPRLWKFFHPNNKGGYSIWGK